MKDLRVFVMLLSMLFILMAISCGGAENTINSSTDNNSAEQLDDTDNPIRLFDGPTDGSGTPGGGGH